MVTLVLDASTVENIADKCYITSSSSLNCDISGANPVVFALSKDI